MKPFLKVNHRNKHVFLHLVRMSRIGRTTTMMRMKPDEAERLWNTLIDLASRARGKKPNRVLKIKRA